MPTSNLVVAPSIVLGMVGEVHPRRVLDVGPGHGKYGLLLREYLGRHLRRLEAIEAEPRYADSFPWLRSIYDALVIGDITEQPDRYLAGFDLVLMVDVLEHIDHDAAVALLARIPGRIVVCTPRYFFQNPEANHGWPTERHRSLWTAESIQAAAGRPLEVNDADCWERLAGVLVRVSPKQ